MRSAEDQDSEDSPEAQRSGQSQSTAGSPTLPSQYKLKKKLGAGAYATVYSVSFCQAKANIRHTTSALTRWWR